MSQVPEHLKYSEEHEWIDAETNNLIAIGITDHAQETLGDIVFLDLPEVGQNIQAGETVGVVESVKAASDIYSPISGKVVERNQALLDSPYQVNRSPYDHWLFKIEPSQTDALTALLDSEAYKKLIGE